MQRSWWLLDFVLFVSCTFKSFCRFFLIGDLSQSLKLSTFRQLHLNYIFIYLRFKNQHVIFKTLLTTNRMYFSSVIYCTLHCRNKMYCFKIMLLLDESLSISQIVLKNAVLPFFLWVTEMWTCGIVCCDSTNHFARYKK